MLLSTELPGRRLVGEGPHQEGLLAGEVVGATLAPARRTGPLPIVEEEAVSLVHVFCLDNAIAMDDLPPLVQVDANCRLADSVLPHQLKPVPNLLQLLG